MQKNLLEKVKKKFLALLTIVIIMNNFKIFFKLILVDSSPNFIFKVEKIVIYLKKILNYLIVVFLLLIQFLLLDN